jgi:hypothetical protein
VVGEVHDECAHVRNRIAGKVGVAARMGYGLRIATTEESTARTFRRGFVGEHAGSETTVDGDADGELEPGTMLSDVLPDACCAHESDGTGTPREATHRIA